MTKLNWTLNISSEYLTTYCNLFLILQLDAKIRELLNIYVDILAILGYYIIMENLAP